MSDELYVKLLEGAAFDVVNGSYANSEKALLVLRAVLTENIQSIRDPRVREYVRAWRTTSEVVSRIGDRRHD